MDQDHEPVSAMDVVAQRVRDLRKSRGWSAQRLADELTAVGIEWERIVVSRLETGRRQALSVAELLGLAQVFRLSPLALLFQKDGDILYRVAPNVTAPTKAVYQWIIGDGPPPLSSDGATNDPQDAYAEATQAFLRELPFARDVKNQQLIAAREQFESDMGRQRELYEAEQKMEVERRWKHLEGQLNHMVQQEVDRRLRDVAGKDDTTEEGGANG